jgi:hypothetical protein
VARARAKVGAELPAALVALWDERDGLLTASGVTVYPASDIGERNAAYEVALYTPGFIGDDSGGRGFLLRAGDADSTVFSSDLGDLGPADFDVESADLASWIATLGPDAPRPR